MVRLRNERGVASRHVCRLTLLTLHWRHEVLDLFVTPEAFAVMEKVPPLFDVYCQVGEGSLRRGSSKAHDSLSAGPWR
jgi:hypothetical protein